MHYVDIIGQDDTIARLSAFSDFYRTNGSTTEHILRWRPNPALPIFLGAFLQRYSA